MTPFRAIKPAGVGSGCSVCFGTGTVFGNVATPDAIACIVSGILKGAAWDSSEGEPANGSYKLSQIAPCQFSHTSGSLTIKSTWNSAKSILSINFDVFSQFSDSASTLCLLKFANDLTDSAASFYNGNVDLIIGV